LPRATSCVNDSAQSRHPRFEQDAAANGRKPIADLAQLPQLLFVVGEDEDRARVLHGVADLFAVSDG